MNLVPDLLRDVVIRAGEEAGVALSDLHIGQLGVYLTSLAKWNRTINLTALKLDGFPPDSVHRLLVEPLRGAKRIGQTSGKWVDLGSGGGSPALPMRVLLGDTALTMVESRGRKAAFLRSVASEMGLASVTVEDCRIEEMSFAGLTSSVQLVSARALKIDRAVAEAVRTMLADGGRVALYGRTDLTQLSQFLDVSVEFDDGMAVLVPRGTSSRGTV